MEVGDDGLGLPAETDVTLWIQSESSLQAFFFFFLNFDCHDSRIWFYIQIDIDLLMYKYNSQEASFF